MQMHLFVLQIITGLTLASPQLRERLPYGVKLKGRVQGPLQLNNVSYFTPTTNIMDCKCGTFAETVEEVGPWSEEGVTSLNRYPWSASLVSPGGLYAFCGGSLVNDRYVLTSAACVDGSNSEGLEVLIGTWPNAHFTQSEEPDQLNSTGLIRKQVVRVVLHPLYKDGNLEYNIALLRLKGPVPTFGDSITPVCLPPSSSISNNFDGVNASSLLWRFDQYEGAIIPRRRSEVEWNVLSEEECRGLKYNEEWEQMSHTMMCTRTPEPLWEHPYKDTFDCPGDAGGFLVTTEGTRKVQIGVDSWTACYGRPNGVGLFTRVTEFVPWINRHIMEDGRHCSKY